VSWATTVQVFSWYIKPWRCFFSLLLKEIFITFESWTLPFSVNGLIPKSIICTYGHPSCLASLERQFWFAQYASLMLSNDDVYDMEMKYYAIKSIMFMIASRAQLVQYSNSENIRVLARSKKKSAFTWNWEIYFSLKPGISLWVLGHAVAPSRFLKFLCLWNGISHILGVILSKCSYKHVFNGVLKTLNFYNYFLADPNWEIATSR
jgi:hypothetical protein